MSNVLVEETSLEDIADAIRSKNGTQTKYKPADMADAISAISGTTPTGTKNISITQNGTTTENVTNYASAQITTNVPNSYSASDEGKVVSSGALVSQSSQTITENGTYDTTLKNSVVVNVQSGGAQLYEGVVEISDQRSLSLTIPVAHTDADNFLIYAELIETGTVSDGVVTKDNVVTLRYFLNPQFYAVKASPTIPLTTQTGTTFTGKSVGNVATYYMSNTSTNGVTTPNIKTVAFPAGNSFVIPSASSAQYTCQTGHYTKYSYKVWLF